MQSKDLPKEKEQIIKCFYCGNETLMQKVGEYSWMSRDMEFSNFEYLFKYELFLIKLTFAKNVWTIKHLLKSKIKGQNPSSAHNSSQTYFKSL